VVPNFKLLDDEEDVVVVAALVADVTVVIEALAVQVSRRPAAPIENLNGGFRADGAENFWSFNGRLWTPPPSRCVFASRHLPRFAWEEKAALLLPRETGEVARRR
jgi:hypothetical protein